MKLRFVYSLVIVGLVIFYGVTPTTMHKPTILTILVIVFLCLLLFWSRRERYDYLKKHYIKHSTLAIIGLVIVSFQYPLDYVLGNFEGTNSTIWVNHAIVLRALVLSAIGLLCFLLGYLLCNPTFKKYVSYKEPAIAITFLVLFATVALTVYFVTVNPLYLAGHYKLGTGQNAYYAITFYRALIIAAVIQKCRNIVIKRLNVKSFVEFLKLLGFPLVCLNVIYLLSVLISGDRAPLISFTLIFLSGYLFVARQRLSLRSVVILFLIGAFCITILGTVRQKSTDLSFLEKLSLSLTNVHSPTESRSVSPPTYELARSIRTIHTAVDYVPEYHEFLYGRFQVQSILAAVPFSGFFFPLLFDESEKYSSSGVFITWIRQGNFPSFGDGTSAIADFYLDFGIVGVILGMLLYGYMMRYGEILMFKEGAPPTLFAHIFFTIYLISAIYIARGSVLRPFADCVNVYLFIVANAYISRRVFKVQ